MHLPGYMRVELLYAVRTKNIHRLAALATEILMSCDDCLPVEVCDHYGLPHSATFEQLTALAIDVN